MPATDKQKGNTTTSSNAVPILVAIIGALATILATLLLVLKEPITAWFTSPELKTLTIEEIPQRVFAYYGEAENAGGFAKLDLLFDGIDGKPSYALDYNIPGDQKGYVGLAFTFDTGSNLSKYNAVECTILFSQLSDVVDLYFKDIANNFNTIRISNNGANEMMLRYELRNFPKINFNAVKEVGIVVSSDFSSGSHQVRIKNVRFIK